MHKTTLPEVHAFPKALIGTTVNGEFGAYTFSKKKLRFVKRMSLFEIFYTHSICKGRGVIKNDRLILKFRLPRLLLYFWLTLILISFAGFVYTLWCWYPVLIGFTFMFFAVPLFMFLMRYFYEYETFKELIVEIEDLIEKEL